MSAEPQSLSPKQHRKFKRRMKAREALSGYLFISPWLLGFILFVSFPLVYSVYISFHHIGVSPDGSKLVYEYIGWENYKFAILGDVEFPVKMVQFFSLSLFTIPIIVIFALVIALMINQKFPGRMMFRAIFFVPVIFATGQLLTELVVNQNQGALPLDEGGMLSMADNLLPKTLSTAVGQLFDQFVTILWFSGVQIIIFLAAFQTIPATTYEAAQIDGATPWESFWKITFPALVPFIFLNLIFTIVDLSTNPLNPAMREIAVVMYQADLGIAYASALGYMYLSVVFIPMVALVFIFRKTFQAKG